MLDDPQALFILDAITLRGIGSYLYGARLDIKPLTILCGANGSGKSTWLKALNILKESLNAGTLPYGFPVSDWSPNNIQLTNAFFHLASPEEIQTLDSDDATASFGSPGTIGLEVHATQDCRISDRHIYQGPLRGPLIGFLHCGIISTGDRFRVRIAHPTYWSDSAQTPELQHVIELTFNDRHVIKMEGERDPLQRFEEECSRPRRTKSYTLSSSKSFLSGSEDDDEIIPIANIQDLNDMRFDSLVDDWPDEEIVTLLESFEKIICELLRLVLDGYFYIGAIRQPHTSLKVAEDDRRVYDLAEKRARHVGTAGERSWLLERYYGLDLMRRIPAPRFSMEDLGLLQHAVPLQLDHPKIKPLVRVIGRLSPECLGKIVPVLSNVESLSDENKMMIVEGLNGLLQDSELFSPDVWGEYVDHYDDNDDLIGVIYRLSDPDLRRLQRKACDERSDDYFAIKLPPEELALFNYLLILEAFDLASPGLLTSKHQCLFREYLSSWLNRLVNVDLTVSKRPLLDKRNTPWSISQAGVASRLDRATPYLRPSDEDGWAKPDLSRLSHACFGVGDFGASQPPRQLSAGFHQVFPVLVQLGVMNSGELLGIENPEVHLHPALQIRITEMLIAHAVSGRRIIVETHSDLVLRRVIRAVLEEEIAQSQVQVYFASLNLSTTATANDLSATFQSSSLEPIRVNNKGQIANWPKGFLDEDVLESQRLMDVMYGQESDEEDDDE